MLRYNLCPTLYPPELQKCYFLFNHKQICSKVPILLYFVRPKDPSGNYYVSCFITLENTFDCVLLSRAHK